MNKPLLSLLVLLFLSSCGYNRRPDLEYTNISFEGSNEIDTIITKSDIKETINMDTTLSLPNTTKSLVVRTDFSSDATWDQVCMLISLSGIDYGFSADVEYINQKEYENLQIEQFYPRNENFNSWYIFVVDSLTMNHDDHPILCINLNQEENNTFRLVPKEMWTVDNNLAISNMDFWEFQDEADSEGIFRGF